MIFSCHKNIKLPFELKIFNYVIEREKSARFLGVIIDENLTWREHILAVKAKISRYVGILFKLKSILPLPVRKNIYYSLIQSHLNYCTLVWGLGTKSSIEPLFAEQKKAIRALMPGFNLNFRRKNTNPCHTKLFFIESGILTVQSIILTNILTFMYRFYNKIQPNIEWFNKHSMGKYRNTICFKGPLFYEKYIAEIQAKYQNIGTTIPIVSQKYFKTHTKALMLEVQGRGGSDEWEGQNMALYNVPGLVKSKRNTTKEVTYTHFYE